MSTWTIFDPNAYPRLPSDPNLWNWKVVVQFTRIEAGHINELEMRSFLSSFFVASPDQAPQLEQKVDQGSAQNRCARAGSRVVRSGRLSQVQREPVRRPQPVDFHECLSAFMK